MHTMIVWVVRLLELYLIVGVVFGIPFVLRGVGRVDPVARTGTWGFRLIVLPGVIALWPMLLRRWMGGRQPPRERNDHRDAAERSSS